MPTTPRQLEALIDELIEHIHEIGDDTSSLTPEQSYEFYEAVASDCHMSSQALRQEYNIE